MKFDVLQVMESMEKEFYKYGTSEVSVSMSDLRVQFRLTVITSSERHNSQFYILRNLLTDDSKCVIVNAIFREAYFKLRRLIHYGF